MFNADVDDGAYSIAHHHMYLIESMIVRLEIMAFKLEVLSKGLL